MSTRRGACDTRCMNTRRFGLGALAVLLVSTAGCFESHGPLSAPCEVQRPCFDVDALGCCDNDRVTLRSTCEVCPAGTVDPVVCRRAGCDVPPLCDSPLACVQDLGAGCCGLPIRNDSCETCPAGSITHDRCDQYQPECGCDDIRRVIPPLCVREVVDGCCDFNDTQEMSVCGCPDGYVNGLGCRDDGAPMFGCAQDLGAGCCGAATVSACGACRAGTVPEEECTDFSDGDRDVPAIPTCYARLEDGGCGCPTDPNTCGGCPEDSIPGFECSTTLCVMP